MLTRKKGMLTSYDPTPRLHQEVFNISPAGSGLLGSGQVGSGLVRRSPESQASGRGRVRWSDLARPDPRGLTRPVNRSRLFTDRVKPRG